MDILIKCRNEWMNEWIMLEEWSRNEYKEWEDKRETKEERTRENERDTN